MSRPESMRCRGIAVLVLPLALLGASLILAVGCGGRLEERFQEMEELEDQVQRETEGFRGDVRVLRPDWNVGSTMTEGAEYEREFLEMVRSRSRIQKAYRDGGAGQVETRRQVSEFLARGRDLVAKIRSRRDQILAMREMSDEAAVRITEIHTHAETLRAEIEKLTDPKKKLLFESRLLVIQKGVVDARPLLESGMRQIQVDPEPARVAYQAGMNKLAEVDAALRDLLRELREG